ncbi:type I restriction endonuclease [Cohnella massiliensis]|uniref:type I restriction endonuclease n=1 Tax=Cohnella massiliensis TaxID=1816691 RepID=UPI0009BB2957|nr:type I restriction endonuclease [Cohnella massiliensis]
MDNFSDKIKSLSKRVSTLKDRILTEEATKTSIIMPFFQLLNYDVFNPEEFVPEFVADVGIKKGEKVDFAILQNGEPVILIEAKSIQEKLTKHDSQLFRYFGTTRAKFAILTNGIHYRFYTDLEKENVMDTAPFFEFNLLEIKDSQISELIKFRKDDFDVENILTTASELKYTNEIKNFLIQQFDNPSDALVSLVISDIYPGKKTKQVIEKFGDLVKKSFKQMLSEMLNDKFKAAIETTNASAEISSAKEVEQKNLPQEEANVQIVTTEEEIEGYAAVKILLSETVDPSRVFYRDNMSYFNILIDDNIRKWICRLGFNTGNKYIQFNDEERTTFNISGPTDIISHKEKIIETALKFI